MSTRYDYLDAKARYQAHACNRTCPYPCLAKRALWAAMMAVAGRMGAEPGDNDRQREQYYERVPHG